MEDHENHIVVFDVDRTLISCDSMLLAAYKCRKNYLSFLFGSISCIFWVCLFKLKIITIEKLKEKFLICFKICEKFNFEERNGNKNWFLPYLLKNIQPKCLERLNYHKSKGHKIYLCSASLQIFLEPLANYLNVELICTKIDNKENYWKPSLKTKNCNGNEKVNRLSELIGQDNIKNIESYGDSKGDKELLEISKIPHFRSFSHIKKVYPLFPLNKLIAILALAIFFYSSFFLITNRDNLYPIFFEIWDHILFGILLITFSYLIRYLRWKYLISSISLKNKIKDDFIIWMASYAFTATPGKTGEFLRAYLLKEKFNFPISKTIPAVIVERITDGLSVLCIVIINFKLISEFKFLYIKDFFLVILIFLIIFLTLYLSKKIFRNLIKPPKFIKEKFNLNFFEYKSSISILLSAKVLILASLLGTISWSLEGYTLYLLINSLGFNSISYGFANIVHSLSGAIGAISMLPGGIGGTEISIIGILISKNIPVEIATSITLLIRLMTLWFATFLGMIFLFIYRLDKKYYN